MAAEVVSGRVCFFFFWFFFILVFPFYAVWLALRQDEMMEGPARSQTEITGGR